MKRRHRHKKKKPKALEKTINKMLNLTKNNNTRHHEKEALREVTKFLKWLNEEDSK